MSEGGTSPFMNFGVDREDRHGDWKAYVLSKPNEKWVAAVDWVAPEIKAPAYWSRRTAVTFFSPRAARLGWGIGL